MYYQPKPPSPSRSSRSTNGQIAKKSIRTMTKDLSVTVPFSPAIVLGPSSKTGDLVAVSRPNPFQPFTISTTFPRDKRQGTRRTLVEGVASDGGTEGKSANDVGPGRTSGDGGECPGCKQCREMFSRSLPRDNRWRDLPEEREAVRRP